MGWGLEMSGGLQETVQGATEPWGPSLCLRLHLKAATPQKEEGDESVFLVCSRPRVPTPTATVRPGGRDLAPHSPLAWQGGSSTLRCDSRHMLSPAAHLPCSPACHWGIGAVFWGKRAARTPQRQNLRPTESWVGWTPSSRMRAGRGRPQHRSNARQEQLRSGPRSWPRLTARPAATSLQKAIYCTDDTVLVQPTLLVTTTATVSGLPQGQRSLCPGHCRAGTGPV